MLLPHGTGEKSLRQPGRTVEFPLRQLPYLSLCLLQPEPHLHLPIHSRGRGQVLVGLRTIAGAAVELAEAEMAVGDEGAHAEV
jgi:hypothetical protein